MKLIEMPECPDYKENCFACRITYDPEKRAIVYKCGILTEGIQNCPFYKTGDEFKRGVRHGQEN